MPGQRFGQARPDLVDDAGPEQELAQLRGLRVEDLGHQVRRHVPGVSAELPDDPLRVGLPGKVHGREHQAGRPAVGPGLEFGDVRGGQFEFVPAHQRRGLVRRERQLIGPDLGNGARQPVEVQGERRVGPRHQDNPHASGVVAEEAMETLPELRRHRHVAAVHHEHQYVVVIVADGLHDGRWLIAAVQGDAPDHGRTWIARCPRIQQHRLSEARGRTHQCERPMNPEAQAIDKTRPRHCSRWDHPGPGRGPAVAFEWCIR